MLEKIRERPGNMIISYIEFSSKMDPKLTIKTRNTTFAAKIDEKSLPGTTFLGKNQFSVVLEIPERTPKLLKIYQPL